MISFYATHHLFDNRVYISTISKEEIKRTVIIKNEEEPKGAGIRCYSKPIGFLLSLLGISSKISSGDKNFYINNKSFSKFIIRTTELREVDSAKEATKLREVYTAKEATKKLNDLFIEHKKTGYDKNKLNLVNERTKNILKNNEIKDISQMIIYLKMVAIHESKNEMNN